MRIFLFVLFVICSFSSYAQVVAPNADGGRAVVAPDSSSLSEDTICIHEYRSGTNYIYNGKVLELKEMEAPMKSNPDAFQWISIARESNIIGRVLLLGGSLLIVGNLGYYVYNELISKNRPYSVDSMITPSLKLGVGLIIVTIPFVMRTKYAITEAVTKFNKGKRVRTSSSGIPLHLGVGPCGISLSMNF